MAGRGGSSALYIAKLLTETTDFRSSEITDAVSEYFDDSGVHDDSDEWNSDHEANILEEDSTEASQRESVYIRFND